MAISLRRFAQGDEHALVSLLNNAQVQRFLSPKIPYPYTEADASWWVREGAQSEHIYAIEHDNELIGCISATVGQFEYAKSAEVGYWLGQSYWHQGFASEALQQLLSKLAHGTDLLRLHAVVFAGNKGSQALLTRCGFVLEGRLRQAIAKQGQRFDGLIYGLLLDDIR